jgi:putative ABC transport system substrate-binding protein
VDLRRADDIALALARLDGRVEVLYFTSNPLFLYSKPTIRALALKARLPDVNLFREEVAAVGLLSYGPDFPDLFRRAAELVDKIKRGANPADIPVEQSTKFNLVINLKTAHALGLTIPHNLLVLADEVIE